MPSTDAPARAKTTRAVSGPKSAGTKNDGRRNDTRERLITSAMRMFNQNGYSRTTVAEIERDVGLRPGSGGLYRHFRSKDDLLLEAVTAYHARVRELRAELASTSTTPGRPLADDLRDLVVSLAGFLADEGPMVRLSLDAGGLPAPVRRAVGAAWDDGYGMLSDLLVRHGLDERAATLVSVGMLGSLNHYFTHIGIWHTQPSGIDPADFLQAWVGQVDAVVEVARADDA